MNIDYSSVYLKKDLFSYHKQTCKYVKTQLPIMPSISDNHYTVKVYFFCILVYILHNTNSDAYVE